MISVPTRTQLVNDLKAYLSARVPDIILSKDTDAGARIEMIADALFGLYVEALQIQKDIFPKTASASALEEHANLRLTEGRLAAAGSSGDDNLTVVGEIGSVVTVGDRLVDDDGLEFEITKGGTLTTTTLVCSVSAISTGLATNKEIGEVLSFVAPGSGIETDAEITGSLAGGIDEETDGELKERVIFATQNPPAGGRFSDYYLWARSIPGVADAYVYGPSSVDQDGIRGKGVVDVVITTIGEAAERVPSDELIQSVQDKIDDNRPCTTSDSLARKPTVVYQNVRIKVEPQTQYAWDWDSGIEYVVTWTPGSLALQITSVPSDMEVGHRILLNSSDTSPEPEVKTIMQIVGDVLTLDSDFATNNQPQPGDTIWPAGPLTLPCINAIKNYFDTLGPARGTAANPDQIWEDTARVSQFFDVIMDIDGVKDMEMVIPTVNVAPADPDENTVELLCWQMIIIEPM